MDCSRRSGEILTILSRNSKGRIHSQLQSINVVECPELRELLLYIGTDLQDRDIPHRTKLSELITSRFKLEYSRMVNEINVSSLRLFFNWENVLTKTFFT
jgi:hypothetical protein